MPIIALRLSCRLSLSLSSLSVPELIDLPPLSLSRRHPVGISFFHFLPLPDLLPSSFGRRQLVRSSNLISELSPVVFSVVFRHLFLAVCVPVGLIAFIGSIRFSSLLFFCALCRVSSVYIVYI